MKSGWVMVIVAVILLAGCRGSMEVSHEAALPVAPSITTQPAAQSVALGQSATFSVVASGDPAPTFRWLRSGAPIPGAVNASYSTPPTVRADNGASFSVVVTNSVGAQTSLPATLTVQWAPKLLTQPLAQAALEGQPAVFSLLVDGNPVPTCQWQRDGQDIPGATGTTYTTPPVGLADAGSVFTAVLSNSLGSVTCNPAVLTVIPLLQTPTFTAQPSAQAVIQGGTATFTVVAVGNGTLSYQWTKGGVDIPGANSATLTIANAQTADAASYACVATNTLNGKSASATSSGALLAVNLPPVISSQPTSLTRPQGATAAFSVVASGNGVLTYQWTKDGIDIPSGTAATLTLSSLQAADAASYACVVANTLGGTRTTLVSALAVLAVNVPPTISSQPLDQAAALGAAVNFTVLATGSGTLSYQWAKDGVALPGETAAVLSIASAKAGDAGVYRCTVTNTLNGTTTSTVSAGATLQLNVPPIITLQPKNQTLALGGTALFTLTATGSGSLSYQWSKDGIPIAGATTPTLSLANVQAADAATYACVVTNTLNGTTTSTSSANAVLTLLAPPIITTHPLSQTLVKGSLANLSVAASGAGTLSYQWTKGGINIGAATSATLSLANIQGSDAGTYACVVTATLNGTTASAISANAILSVNVPPVITAQPLGQTVAQGSPASFTVLASGNGTLSYQWSKGGTAIVGATAATLTLASAQVADAGSYACVVTNTLNGTVTSTNSANAVLSVNVPPTITTQPISQTKVQGSSATFAVAATGNGTLSYQWTRGGTPIAGATLAALTIASVQPADAATYACIVTNTLNGIGASSTSANAVLTVNIPPAFTTHPVGQTVILGGTATFSVVATGSGILSYQWTKGGVNIAGATSPTLTLANVSASDAGSYACAVSNALNGTFATATSLHAALAVNVPPAITTQPLSQTKVQGSLVSLVVAATGNGSLSYQWTKGGVDLPGSTSATLSLSNVQPVDEGTYACAVTNTLTGTVTTTLSAGAVLTVNVPPTFTAQPSSLTVIQGGTASLSVAATGSGTLSYQWTKGGSNLAGATASTLVLNNVQPSDAATYACVVTNTLNGTQAPASSAGAVLTVNTPPTLTTQPLSQTRIEGGTATFTLAATGSGTLSYQWFRDGSSLAGATSATLTLTPLQAADAATYACVVTNTLNGTVTSTPSANAVLQVNLIPSITGDPLSQTLAQGGTANFTVAATGNGTLSFQWTKGGTNIAGATAATLSIVNVQAADAATYACVVKNTLNGTITQAISAGAVLTVNLPPTLSTQPQSQTLPQGDTATFTLAASGSGVLSYQWQKGGSPIAGATGTSLVLTNIQAADGAVYTCQVTNTLNGTTTSTTSAAATLTVITPPITPVVTIGTFVTAGKAGLSASTPDQGAYNTCTWVLTGGTLTGGQGTNTITYTAGGVGTLTATVTVANVTGSASGSANATVVALPSAELAFPPSVHPGDAWMQASVPTQTGTTCLWSILAGTGSGSIASGQGTQAIGFTAGGSTGTFQLVADVQNQAGDHVTSSKAVKVQVGTWLVKNGGAISAGQAATATLLPNGRVLVAGGYGASLFSGYLTASSIYDPATRAWTQTQGSMATARQSHTATLLPNGTVLVVGGENGTGVLASCELFDPATGTWTSSGNLARARSNHTATLLPNGTVLVAGGSNASGYLTQCELYDPATKSWSPTTAGLGTGRYWHTATLLVDGTVLVAGGYAGSGVMLAGSELYDPATKTWSPTTGGLGTARYWHSATRLLDGRVLVGGGYGNAGFLASAELYDPSTKTWTATVGGLNTARELHSVNLLPDGSVLVAGGYGNTGYLADAETFDPVSGTWSLTTGPMTTARDLHTATLLKDGTVLAAGGANASGTLANAEIYTPALRTWSPAVTGLGMARALHTATPLNDGTVVVAGGTDGLAALAQSERYDPATRIWTPTAGTLGTARSQHSAERLASGKVLVAGGQDGLGHAFASAELFDPALGTWSPTGSLGTARYGHQCVQLQDGSVLVTGGTAGAGYLASSETYDPASTAWSPTTGDMNTARIDHSATLLPNGTVLVVGGTGASGRLSSAELFDPVARTWSPVASMGAARYAHTATLLQNGLVLVAGGNDASGNPLSTAQLFNPATGTWSATTGSLGVARAYHTATLLGDGRVLVAGGFGLAWDLASCELYNPTTKTWSLTTGALGTARYQHTATLLSDGTVMVAFGQDADAVTEIFKP